MSGKGFRRHMCVCRCNRQLHNETRPTVWVERQDSLVSSSFHFSTFTLMSGSSFDFDPSWCVCVCVCVWCVCVYVCVCVCVCVCVFVHALNNLCIWICVGFVSLPLWGQSKSCFYNLDVRWMIWNDWWVVCVITGTIRCDLIKSIFFILREINPLAPLWSDWCV